MPKTLQKQKSKTKTTKKQPDLRRRVNELLEVIEKSWFEVSLILKDIYEGELYKAWGYESFEDYAKKEVNLEYRSVMYRVQLGKIISEMGFSEKDVVDLGFAKFKEIARIVKAEGMTKSDADLIIEQSKELSYRETVDYLKKVREDIVNKGEAERVKKTKLIFQLLQEQADIVEEALNKALGMTNTDNKNVALEFICAEWLADKVGAMDDEGEEIVEINV